MSSQCLTYITSAVIELWMFENDISARFSEDPGFKELHSKAPIFVVTSENIVYVHDMVLADRLDSQE